MQLQIYMHRERHSFLFNPSKVSPLYFPDAYANVFLMALVPFYPLNLFRLCALTLLNLSEISAIDLFSKCEKFIEDTFSACMTICTIHL